MVRTQIQLDDEQYRELKNISHNINESLSSIIRKSITLFIQFQQNSKTGRYNKAISIIGKYKAETSDISENHDKYLGEDFI